MISTIHSPSLAPAQEAAVLFAEGRESEVVMLLVRSITTDTTAEDLELWKMALDLFRLRGDRVSFERYIPSFESRFREARPRWDPAVDEDRLAAELRLGGDACIQLAGALDATAAIEINARDSRARWPVIRLDATCLQSLDKQACSVLNDTVDRLVDNGVGVYVTGAGRFAHCLRLLLAADSSFRPAWSLLLRLWQLKNEEREFSRAAVEYALAFGVNPPEWEPIVAPVVDIASVEEKRSEPRYQSGPEVLRLSGTMLGSHDFQLKELQNFALDRKYVNVDLSYLRRMDAAAGRALVNLANALTQEGKIVRLLRQHYLLLALLRLFQINESVVCTPLSR